MSDESESTPPAPTADETLPRDGHWLARLRWRCRRGMLENDLILSRYLDLRGETISEAEAGVLNRLLELPDNELWDLVSGRQEATAPELAALLRAMSSVLWSADAAAPEERVAGEDTMGSTRKSCDSRESVGRAR